ncbi:hypothetical protein D3C81_258470 [compost metagenome]
MAIEWPIIAVGDHILFGSDVPDFFLTHYDFVPPLTDTTSPPNGPTGLPPLTDMLVTKKLVRLANWPPGNTATGFNLPPFQIPTLPGYYVNLISYPMYQLICLIVRLSK